MLYSSIWWNTIWIQDLKKIHDMNYDLTERVHVAFSKSAPVNFKPGWGTIQQKQRQLKLTKLFIVKESLCKFTLWIIKG